MTNLNLLNTQNTNDVVQQPMEYQIRPFSKGGYAVLIPQPGRALVHEFPESEEVVISITPPCSNQPIRYWAFHPTYLSLIPLRISTPSSKSARIVVYTTRHGTQYYFYLSNKGKLIVYNCCGCGCIKYLTIKWRDVTSIKAVKGSLFAAMGGGTSVIICCFDMSSFIAENEIHMKHVPVAQIKRPGGVISNINPKKKARLS
jgi:hypothetical protein